MRMWWLWIQSRWRGAAALALAVLVMLGAALLVMPNMGADVQLLGNAAAPRPAGARNGQAGARLPRSGAVDDAPGTLPGSTASVLDTAVAPDADPQTVAAAQAAWSADERARRQDMLVTAINCDRQAQGRPPLRVNATLSATAADAWLTLVHHHDWSLRNLPGRYALRSVVALDDGTSQPANCEVRGLDADTLRTAADATTIGVAVFPPQASWDSPSAVVLIR